MYKYNDWQNNLVRQIIKIIKAYLSTKHTHFLMVIAKKFHKDHLKCVVFRLAFRIKKVLCSGAGIFLNKEYSLNI